MGFEQFGIVSFTSATKAEQFVEFLKNNEVRGTVCKSCGVKYFPPRSDCNACLSSEMDWGIEIFLVLGRISTSAVCRRRNTTRIVSMSMNGTSNRWPSVLWARSRRRLTRVGVISAHPQRRFDADEPNHGDKRQKAEV